MTTLATLTQNLEALCDEVDDCMDVIPEDLLERFANAQMSHAQKCDAYVGAIKGLQHNAAYYNARAEQLTKRAKTCERLEKSIKDRLLYVINANPGLLFKSSDGDKISARNNAEALKVDIKVHKRSFSNCIEPIDNLGFDEMMSFVDVVELLTLNTAKIKSHLTAGNLLTWAHLERGQHLRIK